jgi:hypothetical protein
MYQWAEWIDSWVNNFLDLTEAERTDYLLRSLCLSLAAICLSLCLYQWSFTLRDLGFLSCMALVYVVAKLYLTVVDVVLPE